MRRTLFRIASLLILEGQMSCAAADLIGRVPAQPKAILNPYEGSEDAVRAGAKLFVRECSACHRGKYQTNAPPLDSQTLRSASPRVLFWILRNGSLSRGMPSFAHLPEAQRWQIVAYLKEAAAPTAAATLEDRKNR
jgi:mono/diheme cytochrome c family protein